MTASNYGWNAEDYARNSSGQYEWARELIDKLKLTGNEAVLDIGCGDGKVTVLLAEKVPQGRVTGVDSSPEMIELACGRHSGCENGPAFLLRDARKLDFNREFDAAFSNAALHWFKEHDLFLKGLAASLKRGGRIMLQMGGKGNAADVINVLESMLTEEKWKNYFFGFDFPYGFFSPEEYLPWLEQAGFAPSRVELLPKDMKHQGREGLAGWIRTTWLPYLERVPAEFREEFVDELVSTYLKEIPVDDKGLAHVQMIRLEVEAVLI